MYHVASYMMMGGMISMCYGCMPFIWSNQMMGYGGSPVAVLSPFAVGALGTGAYILKRKKDREDVFYQYYNNYSDDVFDDYSIDDLIIELAKDEIQLRKRKLFDEEREDSKVNIKEKKI